MKIYVICDLEGTAGGVDHKRQCWFNGEYYHQLRRLATLELNALIEGALAGGATEIVAWDGHGPFPGGLDVELVHPDCQLVMGAGGGGPVGLDESFAAMFLCGFHGMAGAKRGVMAHSFAGHVEACWVNGELIGEIGANLNLAGSRGVPGVFICGDRAAADEARTLVPEIETAVVKQGLASARTLLAPVPMLTLAPEKARQAIREAAERAMGLIGKIEPYRIEPPFVWRTRFISEKYTERALEQPNVKRVDALTVELASADELRLVL